MKIGRLEIKKVQNEKNTCRTIFEQVCGYPPNFEDPRSFNEKVNWYKFNYRNKLMTKCSAKDTVRDYVRDVFGKKEAEKLLIPLVKIDKKDAIYKRVSDIQYDLLPNQFMMKVNWGSGQNVLVSDKSSHNFEEACQKLENWMKPTSNPYRMFYEWGYKDIKPRILIEEYLGNWGDVRDYKIFCFNGEPQLIYISDEFDDHKEHIDMDFMTPKWVRTGYERKSYKPPKNPFPQPKSLEQMLDVARKLSKPFPLVRVDLYEINSEPKFSELTFYPSAGWGAFENQDHDFELGSSLSLSLRKPARYLDFLWS